jgi:DNA polymerase-3 subunit delta
MAKRWTSYAATRESKYLRWAERIGHARGQGISERIVLTVETGFDWNTFTQQTRALSLFGERRLFELRLGDASPGTAGSKVLQGYAEDLPADDVLLISMGKLDSKAQQSAWFKAIDKAGVVITIWPVEARDLPQWIQRRMAAHGFNLQPEAAAFIAGRVEGNLLAARQEIDILRLLADGRDIGLDQVLAVVADSSRYDVFQLVDTALAGDPRRALRILQGLRREGVEPVLVNWALTRELRALCRMSSRLSCGQTLSGMLSEFRVWEKRKAVISQTLRRHSAEALREILWFAGRVDRVIKGVAMGNPWEQLTWLCLNLAGQGNQYPLKKVV